jgi:hypothetical protein
MLVDNAVLENIFKYTIVIAVHCEDEVHNKKQFS